MSDIVLIIILLVTTSLLVMVIQLFQVKAAVPKVLAILREHGATSSETAVEAADVGLAELSVFQRALKRRDFKPKAVTAMIQHGLIEMNEEGRIYICEEVLAKTQWADH